MNDQPDFLTMLGYMLMPLFIIGGVIHLIQNLWLLPLLLLPAGVYALYEAWEWTRLERDIEETEQRLAAVLERWADR